MGKRSPNIYDLRILNDYVTRNACESHRPNSWYVPRPVGMCSWRLRFRIAWAVFRGRADAVVWPAEQ